MMRIINDPIITIVVLVFLIAGSAYAELKATKTSEVCEYLAEISLKTTRGWKNYNDDDFASCYSLPKELGYSGPAYAPALKNNLSYYAGGTVNAVDRLVLRLNVNNRAEAEKAHVELLKAVEILIKKALNKPLPENILDAITKGENVSSKIGNATVDVVRVDWPTDKGYEMKVTIK